MTQTDPVPVSAVHNQGPLGPLLPAAGDPAPRFGGFQFSGTKPPAAAGVFILTRRIGDLLYPALIGEAQDLAATIAELSGPVGTFAQDVGGCFWQARSLPRQRAYMMRELIGKYDPPLNTEHRKRRAAPEIAALIPDRASGLAAGPAEHMAAPIVVSEDELVRLVREFYADGMGDPQIGPVFRRAVVDWDGHFAIVQDFWSRTLLGTTRYTGNPFSPHMSLKLTPEHFDRWIELFKTTASRVLQPAAAQRAVAKVEHMSTCFQSGLFLPTLYGASDHASPH